MGRYVGWFENENEIFLTYKRRVLHMILQTDDKIFKIKNHLKCLLKQLKIWY